MDASLLIVGAGPFGLAAAAHARQLGVDPLVVGQPMSFWREHMPTGMLLRSGCDWHLDSADQATIVRFLETRGQTPADAEPLSVPLYLDYVDWFVAEKKLAVHPARVRRLSRDGSRFRAVLDEGEITADRVLLAIGFAPFRNVPPELAERIPAGVSSHSSDLVAPASFRDRRVLIVGGRQSAFESAALLAEGGARSVHVCHRHETPRFTRSDWSWVEPLLARIADDPSWFLTLPDEERKALDLRFWEEGRGKLEPWLGPRLARDEITVRPHSRIANAEPTRSGLRVTLDDDSAVEVDHVIYATGYKPDLGRVDFLAGGDLLDRIERRDGFPVLDERLRTSVEGLHVTSLPATKSFGLFFAFTSAVRASARMLGRALSG